MLRGKRANVIFAQVQVFVVFCIDLKMSLYNINKSGIFSDADENALVVRSSDTYIL